tara:strand:- start:106 stop:702 length:597 start_codon:yes stop_codon:yes gene_type:complete
MIKSLYPEYTYNVMVIGDSDVGKTSILSRINKDYVEYPSSTIGIDFVSTNIFTKNTYNKLHIWDSSGNQIFKSLTIPYYKNCHAFIIVYNLNLYESFKNCQYWINEIYQNASKNVHISIIGNKSDLECNIPEKDINDFCKKHKLKNHTKISSKESTDIEVHNIFLNIVNNISVPKNIHTYSNKKSVKNTPIDKCCIII